MTMLRWLKKQPLDRVWWCLLMAVFFVTAVALFTILLHWATDSKQWYAGMHDANCEGENCRCYERLMKGE